MHLAITVYNKNTIKVLYLKQKGGTTSAELYSGP